MKTKDELPACPVATAVSLIGGKWKLLILRNLKSRPWRFNELQRDLDGISQKVLSAERIRNTSIFCILQKDLLQNCGLSCILHQK